MAQLVVRKLDEELVRLLKIRAPIELVPDSELASAAFALALRTDRTVYDCLYLALAAEREVPMITADRRLHNALREWADLENRLFLLGSRPFG